MERNRKKIVVVFVAAVLGFSVLAVPAMANTTGTMLIGVDTTLDEDHDGDIVITDDGVTLDCDDHWVTGPGTGIGWGITVAGVTDVTIKNCYVIGFEVGIQISNSHDNLLRDNYSEGNTFAGFSFFESSGNTMIGNTAHANDSGGVAGRAARGIALGSNADWNNITANTVTDNEGAGILVWGASNNDVRDNYAARNNIGLAVGPGGDNTLAANVAESNSAEGIRLDDSDRNSVESNTVTDSVIGIAVVNGSTENSLIGNSADLNSRWGFVVIGSDDNVFGGNRADGNSEAGFGFVESSSNTVVKNRAFHNGNYGFAVFDPLSVANLFQENHACQNGLADAEFDGSSSVLVDNNFCDAHGAGGTGELMASFSAFGGSEAVSTHSEDLAGDLASPQRNPEGRLEPFGAPELVCDELMVGTWAVFVEEDRETLDLWTSEFEFDGEPLDTVRTKNKRVAQGPWEGWWWFAEGAPMLGRLDPGLHEIVLTLDGPPQPPDPPPPPFPWVFNTLVDVSSAHC